MSFGIKSSNLLVTFGVPRTGPCLGGSAPPPPRKLKKGPSPKRLNLHIFAIGLSSHLTFTHPRRTTFLKPGL